jgi:hypothetical protein
MAARYWVGGSGTWNSSSTTNWSTTSGGASGASVPTSADDVYFDANSGAGTVTTSPPISALSINFTGFSGTFTGQSTINLYGNLTLAAGMTYSHQGNWLIRGNSTITSNGISIWGVDIAYGFNATMADNMTLSGSNYFDGTTTREAGVLLMTSGNLSVAGYRLTCKRFQCGGTSSRTLNWGTNGVVELTATDLNAIVLEAPNTNNFVLAGTGKFYRNQVSPAQRCRISFGSNDTPSGTLASSFAPNFELVGNVNIQLYSHNFFNDFIAQSYTGNFEVVSPSTAANVHCLGNCLLPNNVSDLTKLIVNMRGTGQLSARASSLNACIINSGTSNQTTLTGPLLCVNELELRQGIFNANGWDVTAYRFTSSNTNTRELSFTGGATLFTITGPDTGGLLAWECTTTTNLTVTNGGSCTLIFTGSSTKTFAGGSKTYGAVRINNTGTLIVTGSNTIGTLTVNVRPATISLADGSTQTITTYQIDGVAGSLVTLNNATGGTYANLYSPNPNTAVTFDYVNISKVNATMASNSAFYYQNGTLGTSPTMPAGWNINPRGALDWFV